MRRVIRIPLIVAAVLLPFGAGLWLFAQKRDQALREEDLPLKLREAAERLWSLRIKGDWMKVWEAFEPGFRDRVPQYKYATRHDGVLRFHQHEIQEVAVSGDSGTTTALAERSFPIMDERLRNATKVLNDIRSTRTSASFTDQWVHIDGTWYLRDPEPKGGSATGGGGG